MPSELKSPTANAAGPRPPEPSPKLFGADWNVPSPLPTKIVTALSPNSATAKSNFPSPLKSPTANPRGLLPAQARTTLLITVRAGVLRLIRRNAFDIDPQQLSRQYR